MFVGSHVESGDASKAVVARLPQVVGNIQTAIGSSTITDASGLAVQIKVGDPVCQGDVIETATDGRVGIRFVDGTVFNLSSSARMVLNEFVCDAGDTLHSAIFGVTRGTFAFIAGQMAKTGCLRIDTPFGNIRSRARGGGMGMLSLTALTFSLMNEVQAAGPGATYLHYDKITFTHLEHGKFELVTKEAIPRLIVVGDPGETVVLTLRNSTISVDQVANSAARMAELQAAQRDVLANLMNGTSPIGSSTPAFGNPLTLHPINFIQTDAPSGQNSLPPLLLTPITVPEIIIVRPPPPPPTLNAATGPTETDTVVFDSFTATSGTFVASSPRSGATLTFGISGGTAGSRVIDGAAYDVSKTGLYGTFYLNSATGAYTLVPNSDAINALKAPTTENFVITVSDGTLSANQTFTVTINGVNDAPIIVGTTAGSVIEVRGVINATPGIETATGTLTDTDVDDPPNTFTAVSSPTKSAGGYGTFTMTAAGVWTYTLDDTSSAVQALKVGDTLIDTFPVTTIDGTPQVVTITIHGPLIATGTPPSLTLSETHLTATALDDNIAGSAPNAALTTTTGDFSAAFTSVQGADGATISYALSIAGGNGTASGLIDSHTGQADVLVLNGNTIEGHVGTTGGTLAFTITVDPTTGLVTFTEYRAVTQPFGGEGGSLTTGIVNLSATIIDKDGNFQTASLDLGSRLTITDDGPMIAATGTAPSLTLSERHLTSTALDDNIAGSAPNAALTTTTGDFSAAFTRVQGADGATINYALSITGGNGTASGLIDSHTGLADVLVLNGNTIEGHVGTTGGTLAFTITLDPATGQVTYTEYRAVTQPFGTSPDAGEGVSLTAGIVNLTATITDKDGDFQTASLDLGSRLTITDDGPTIGGFDHASIVARDNQTASGTYDVNFGGDGDAAMLVTVHDGAVDGTGYNLATTDLGGSITSVHVTGNGVDYTFYYTTHAVSCGVELDAFFTNTSGTLSDPFFTLLINPDGTYTFDIQTVGFLQQTTVSGSDFGASSSGQPSLTAPDGLLVITGDFNGIPADVKASNNGIAVGDSGLQMDQQETLVLTFTPEQTDVSFHLTQWQGNGTADVVFKVYDGATDIHDFNINLPKPSGDALIVVEKTSNPALVNTYTFDSATSTYTLYVGSEFNQIGISYDHEVTGNTTFTVNDITYSEGTSIPSTDLLFDVTAVDRDGDTSMTSLQVDLLGGTVASGFTLSSTSGTDVLAGGSGNATLTDTSVATTADDTITDLESGSDKIDLTALGALAFLALSSTSTVVPPHTVAWLYDSANDETIVYVNSTGETLSIGDSALLEIHLQGIATIKETDFVPEPTTAPVVVAAESIDPALAATAGDGTVPTTTTADVSSDSTVSDGAHIADASWSLQTADEGFSFDFARDRMDSISHAKFTGEALTRSTEGSGGDAVITPASGPSIELHSGHDTALTEDHFTLDQKPMHVDAGAMTIGDGAVTPLSGTIHNADIAAPQAAAEQQLAEHGAHPEGGNGNGPSHSDSNNVSETGAIDTPSNKDHLESIPTNAGSVHADGAHANQSEAAGAPGLGDSFAFKQEAVGSEHSSAVDLADAGHPQASNDHPENTAGSHGPPVISEAEMAQLSPPGHSTDHSDIVPDHAASAAVAHVPHDLLV